MTQLSRRTVLLATDSSHSIIGEIADGKTNAIAFSAYGEQSAQQDVATRLGFNGQLRETKIGWYLLGNGYRAYNPRLMRFHRPDSWSPFGRGGLNAYMYCVGDPVNRSDPTGHVPWIEPVVKRAFRNAFNFLFGGADITGPRKLTRAQGGIIDSFGGMRPEKTNEGKALITLGGAAMANAPEPRLTGVYPSPDVGTHGWTRNPDVLPIAAAASKKGHSAPGPNAPAPKRANTRRPTAHSLYEAVPPHPEYPTSVENMQLLGGEVQRPANYWQGRPPEDQPPPPQPRNQPAQARRGAMDPQQAAALRARAQAARARVIRET